jgi:3-oxoacyl-[acyl-carrier protein] reductase
MLLQNKNILITGGSRGIGAAIVERLAAAGANVAFTYLSSEQTANELVGKLQSDSNKIKAYQSNAANFDEAQSLIEKVIQDFGAIDVLINNAGVTRDNLLLRMSEQHWDEVIDTNLKSVFNLTKAACKPMLSARQGSIINITSIVGLSGQAGQSNYAASKSGIIGFTKSIAQELGSRSIRCNAIAPGFIETDMTDNLSDENKKEYFGRIPLKRFGKASEVADLCLFLASDLSSYVTGQTISVCGGLNN